ncbi:hypothetical protein QEW_4697 [Clostridioides difficile CD160]|nr:hypothetical protein QEW_4697 [Clostridioides difficile CD160]
MDKKDNLILVTEGSLDSIKYFIKNGVYPTTVLLNILDLKEKMLYFTEKDHVLLVIKGFSDFTLKELYLVIEEIEKIKKHIGSFIIMSNVELGIENYYLYEDDLFYGKIEEIKSKKKKTNTENIVSKLLKFLRKEKTRETETEEKNKSEKENNVYSINEVMRGYLVFSNKKDPNVYLKENKSILVSFEDETNQKYTSNILEVDLFK